MKITQLKNPPHSSFKISWIVWFKWRKGVLSPLKWNTEKSVFEMVLKIGYIYTGLWENILNWEFRKEGNLIFNRRQTYDGL